MGRDVPEISFTVIGNNGVIPDPRYAVVYWAFSAALLSSGAANG